MFCHSSVEDHKPPFKIEQFSNPVPLPSQAAQEQSTTCSSENQASGNSVTDLEDQINDSEEKSSLHRDPLHWFGVFVPPALRASQNSFKSAATADIPSLVNAMREMGTLEIEIRRTRKKLRKAS